jgi:choline dehydrogenase-like flavoprotein
VAHDPPIAALAEKLRDQGLSPFPLPTCVGLHEGGGCLRCGSCDGFPCRVDGKGDAETRLIDPALRSRNVELITGAFVERLVTDAGGRRIAAADYRIAGETKRLSADLFVLSAGAVNSAAVLLRSADDGNPRGLANASGMVGRNFMNHNCTALMAIHPLRRNRAVFQKTLAVNDFYLGGKAAPWPLGNMQLLGKIREPMIRFAAGRLPRALRTFLARHSVDWYVMSEDLPDPDSRVRLRADGKIVLAWRRTNLVAHDRLVAVAKQVLRRAGFPLVLAKRFDSDTPSHQCGTVRFGNDPVTAPLDPYCRAHDHENLFVVDASFFPSSAALNPALTIAAQALRAADHIRERDLKNA